MKRAAVLIGVDKTGKLPKLKDAARGARLMETWCRQQGIATTVITDEAGRVSLDQIKQAIFPLADAGNIGQLLVYFAGHGVSLQRQEYWLLSDAPTDTQAAVNVATSAAFAATCGIGHVVLVSDACRTAPEGIQAQSVRGGEIFPNAELDAKPVDQFFACQLGKPSAEVKDPAVTTAEFKALYTNELVPALSGQRSQVVQWEGPAADKRGYVHLRPLRDFLSAAVAQKIANLNLQTRLIQVPVATISSDPPAWISQVTQPADALLGAGTSSPPAAVVTPEAMTAELLSGTMAGETRPLVRGGPRGPRRGPGDALPMNDMVRESRRLAEPFGPAAHESQCGFKLRGGVVADFFAANVKVEFAGGLAHGQDLRVWSSAAPAPNVLLVLKNGDGVLLPAIRDFIGALTFDDDGELVDVAYEPSANSARWGDYAQRAQEIRSLRAIASAASARGSFTLEGPQALEIARRMQVAKGIDPSLAVYAAYAYHDLQRRDLLRQMTDFMAGDLDAPFFDLALLARKLDKTTLRRGAPLLMGAFPLMSQGWALLRAFQVRLPPTLASLEECRRPSLWTVFDAEGVQRIREAFTQGELQ
jgi:hypothetical protein